MPNGESFRKVYDAISTKYNVGTYDEFVQKLQDPNRRKKLYDTVSESFNLGDYNTFNSKLGFNSQEVKQPSPLQDFNLNQYYTPSINKSGSQKRGSADNPYINYVIQHPTAYATRGSSSSPYFNSNNLPEKVKANPVGYGDSDNTTVNQPKESEKAFIADLTAQNRHDKEMTDLPIAVENTADIYFNQLGKTPTPEERQLKVEEIQQKYNNGNIYLDYTPAGKPIMVRDAGFIHSLIPAFKQAVNAEDEAANIVSMSPAQQIEYFNKKSHQEQEYLPLRSKSLSSGLGEMIGGGGPTVARGVAGAVIGATLAANPEISVPLASAGVSAEGLPAFLSFMAMMHTSANSGYANALYEYYIKGKDEGLTDEEAIKKAQTQALVGEGKELAMAAILSKTPSFVKSEAGVKKSLSKYLEESASTIGKTALYQGTVAGGTEAAVQAAAATQYNITPKEAFEKTWEAADGMMKAYFVFHALNMGVEKGAQGLANLPGYAKAQMKGYLAAMPKEALMELQNKAIQSGAITPEQLIDFNKGITAFEQAKAQVPANYPEEKLNALAGLIEKRTNLENKQNDAINNAAPEFKEEAAKQYADEIKSTTAQILKMKFAKEPLKEEKDYLSNGISVIIPEKNKSGKLPTVTIGDIKNEPEVKPKIKVQLPKQSEENELPTVTIGANEETKTEVPNRETVSGSGTGNEFKSSKESSNTEKKFGENLQPQQETITDEKTSNGGELRHEEMMSEIKGYDKLKELEKNGNYIKTEERQKLIDEAKDLSDNVKGIYKGVFKDNTEESLFEAAIQANSSESEKKGAIKTFGKEIIDIAQKLFPDAKVGDKFNSKPIEKTFNVEDWSRDVESTEKAIYSTDDKDNWKLNKPFESNINAYATELMRRFGGGEITYKSPSGSVYFTLLNGERVRVSDHQVDTYDPSPIKYIGSTIGNRGAKVDYNIDINSNIDTIEKEIREQLDSEDGILPKVSREKNIAVAYHKAKADGSNPELIKAVEDLLGKPKSQPTVTKPMGEGGEQGGSDVDDKTIKSRVKRISKSLNVDEQRSQQIHDIALNAKDYEDFKKQVIDLIGDDTVNENRIAEQYDDIRDEAKSEYEKELGRNLEDLRGAYADVTKADAALRKMNETSPKSIRGFIKRLLTGTTPEGVAANKARLVEMQRKYRKEKADMRAMLPRERGANFVIEKLSRAARNGDISQEAADLAIDLIRKQPDMFGDLAISITGKKGENDGVQGWYRAADALVKIFKNPSDETTVAHEVLHHTERFLPHEIRDKIIAEWNNEVNLQIADIQKKLKTETNVDQRQQLTQGLLYLGLAQERQIEPNSENVKSMERIMSKYLGDHTDSQGNFHKGLGNSWYQLYNPSEWWAVNASRLFREAKNKPELKTWTDKAKAFYNYLIEAVKRVFKGSPTAAVEKGLKAVLNGGTLEDREGTQMSASQKLLNIKQKGSFEDRLKSIYNEVNKSKSQPTETKDTVIKQQEGGGTTPTKEEVSKPIESGDEKLWETEPPIINETGDVEGGYGTSIIHSATADIRGEFGIPAYEKNAQTVEQWHQEANDRISKGEMPKLLNKMANGHIPTDVEQLMMGKYIAALTEKAGATKSDADLLALKRAVELSDLAGGSEWGRSGRARQEIHLEDDTLGGMLFREMENSSVDKLTDEQKAKVEQEFNDIQAKKEQAQKDLDALLEKQAEVNANIEFQKQRNSRAKASKDKIAAADIKIQKGIDGAREALKKLRTGESGLGVSVPLVRELVAIAPHVKIALEGLIDKGMVKLSDAVKELHEQFKDLVEGLSEKDIHNIIAGEYNEKKKTQSELLQQKRDLISEAKAINELERLENTGEPKEPKKKIIRNQKIKELRDKIKEHGVTQLINIKNKNESALAKINEQLKTGNFDKERKTPALQNKEFKQKYPDLFKKALESKDALIKARQQREIRLLKEKYANRSRFEKSRDLVIDVLNVPRAVMSSVDYSAPLRQGLIQTVAHPDIAKDAAAFMFKSSASQKVFDRFFYDLKEHPRYEDSQKAGLSLTDPHDPILSAKEEQFMTNIAQKIPVGGALVKGSERAYVGYLNKMRWDLYNRYADAFEMDGKTFQNSEKLYKALAEYINSTTGRGTLGKFEESAKVLNALFFSPRLIASRVRLLTNFANPNWYYKTPKEIRVLYFKDMAKFIGAGLTTLGLAALAGNTLYKDDDKNKPTIELDPRSSDFLKIKVGNTRYDIWGGFQQYIRASAQLFSGTQKTSTTGELQHLTPNDRWHVATKFLRGKTSPVVATGLDFLTGETVTGDRVQWQDELLKSIIPLTIQDVASAVKDNGVRSIFTVGIPATFGVGTETYNSTSDKQAMYDRNLTSEQNVDINKLKKYVDDKPVPVTKNEFKKYTTLRDKYIKEGIDKLYQNGAPVVDNDKVMVKEFKDLSTLQVQSEIKKIKSDATDKAKEELFPVPKSVRKMNNKNAREIKKLRDDDTTTITLNPL